MIKNYVKLQFSLPSEYLQECVFYTKNELNRLKNPCISKILKAKNQYFQFH